MTELQIVTEATLLTTSTLLSDMYLSYSVEPLTQSCRQFETVRNHHILERSAGKFHLSAH